MLCCVQYARHWHGCFLIKAACTTWQSWMNFARAVALWRRQRCGDEVPLCSCHTASPSPSSGHLQLLVPGAEQSGRLLALLNSCTAPWLLVAPHWLHAAMTKIWVLRCCSPAIQQTISASCNTKWSAVVTASPLVCIIRQLAIVIEGEVTKWFVIYSRFDKNCWKHQPKHILWKKNARAFKQHAILDKAKFFHYNQPLLSRFEVYTLVCISNFNLGFMNSLSDCHK